MPNNGLDRAPNPLDAPPPKAISAQLPTPEDLKRGEEWINRPLSHEDGRLLVDVACGTVAVADVSAELIRIANQIHLLVRARDQEDGMDDEDAFMEALVNVLGKDDDAPKVA